MKQKQQKAYLKSNVWGNYYVIIGRKKVLDRMGKTYNKPDIIEWIAAHYPNAIVIDQTKY